MTVPGLAPHPFRATRYASGQDLGARLCPPYDVVSPAERAALVEHSDTNAVRLILPEQEEAALAGGDPRAGAARLLDSWVDAGILVVDRDPALYVYELAVDGQVTRGLVGAVELRDPADGVILPHENTMAGPVADRLALMAATEADLEPIFLVYDGGGATSALVAAANEQAPVATAQTPDGTAHRLWAVTDPDALAAVAEDLAGRRALIADGHHRYATYLQRQAMAGGRPGPWDRGLALLVDSTAYGPQVHPIHRVVRIGFGQAEQALVGVARVSDPLTPAVAQQLVEESGDFAVALAQGDRAVVVSELDAGVVAEALGGVQGSVLGRLDATLVHRVLVQRIWGLPDDEETVAYAHTAQEALSAADADRTAVLVRATPVADVAAVARAGERMPRKSTLFAPKPASGLVIRRLADDAGA